MKHVLGGREWSREWRFAALAGATGGLALAPLAPPDPALAAVGAAPIAVMGLAALRPAEGSRPAAALTWLTLLALATALAGLLGGGARLHAIDGGALRAQPGVHATLSGFVTGVPRRDHGEVAVRVDSPGGRVLVISPEPVAELPVGSEVRAEGVLQEPEPWRAPYLRRQGARAHDWFAGVSEGKGVMRFFLLPMHSHPDLLDGISPALRKRKTGASLFAFKTLDDERLAELEGLVARAFDRYMSEGE